MYVHYVLTVYLVVTNVRSHNYIWEEQNWSAVADPGGFQRFQIKTPSRAFHYNEYFKVNPCPYTEAIYIVSVLRIDTIKVAFVCNCATTHRNSASDERPLLKFLRESSYETWVMLLLFNLVCAFPASQELLLFRLCGPYFLPPGV